MAKASENAAGRFVGRALDEFVNADPGRHALAEATALSHEGQDDEAYRLLRASLRKLGRWRAEAVDELVRIALRTRIPHPVLSDEFAELVRLVKGSGRSLLPVLEVFELAGHEERKELLFDHIGRAPETVGDALPAERLHSASMCGNWMSPALVQAAGKSRQKCYALWEACTALVFPEREPWSIEQLDAKIPLPDFLRPVLKPLLELKVIRTAAARNGAVLRLPRPAGAPAVPVRAQLDTWCRTGCGLREMICLWADAALLVSQGKSPMTQREIVERLEFLIACESPCAGCKHVPRDEWLRRRTDRRLREWAGLVLRDLGRSPAPALPPPEGLIEVPAGTVRGRSMGVPGFRMTEHLITRIAFAEFDPSIELRRAEEHRPMTNVNWFQAAAFARRFGGRLPSSSEWWSAHKADRMPTNPEGMVLGTPANDDDPVLAEWSADWSLAGSEKVKLNVPVKPAAPGALPGPGEGSLSPVDREMRLGLRVAL